MNDEKEILNLFSQEIRKRLGASLRRIVLFGSRARGDNDPDSDYDFLVVVDHVTANEKRIIDELAGEFLYKYDCVVCVILKPESQLMQEPYTPFLIRALAEGVVL